ncbi:uncharacterized protein LOC128952168 [Oppia nitens]|uniref:uncharacterized protein LOC128952168 n=1 Tax=Oppia nitens TaxID=1686743 RepID=UPI0023D9EB1F|nr:uncharacterized protein LOC128952168 [Oppia nitens]
MMTQIVLLMLLLTTIITNKLICEGLAIKPNSADSSQNRILYPKSEIKDTVRQSETKPSLSLQPPSILSDYYNQLIQQKVAQNRPQLPLVNNWPQPDLMPPSNNNDYEGFIDDYYSDDTGTGMLNSAQSDTIYGSDSYQPEGWFNGPAIYDTPDIGFQNDESNDAQMNALMMAYLLDQFDKINKIKDQNNKRSTISGSDSNNIGVVTTTTQPLTTESSVAAKITTHAIPKKLTAKQFRLFQRGQKEFPLLRPAADEDKTELQQNQWPTELDETNLSQEDSLLSLKQQNGKLRPVRDVLTAQLDSLKKEGPKIH